MNQTLNNPVLPVNIKLKLIAQGISANMARNSYAPLEASDSHQQENIRPYSTTTISHPSFVLVFALKVSN